MTYQLVTEITILLLAAFVLVAPRALSACERFSLWPTSTMAWMAGINSCPSPVSAYSTDGGFPPLFQLD